MKYSLILLVVSCALGQQVGSYTAENHPALTTYTCTAPGQCNAEQHSVVLDSNWRWLHKVGDYKNCYTGNTWDASLCPDPTSCATNCAIEGADYGNTYGITTGGNSLNLRFVTYGQYGTNIGSRVYLLDDANNYKLFKLKNREFTFDVDLSQLPCGLNGALYFVEMPQNGGLGVGNNRAGAKYGTGYCDGQCPHDMKFISGEANVLNWTPNPNDKNSGTGKYGTCCSEMDIWEANSMATAYTAHDCNTTGLYRCEGTACGDIETNERYQGVCDKDGCDFNSFRLGDKSFFGKGLKVDSSRPFSVITQFVTSDNTDAGTLVEIRRLWKQNGQVIPNSVVKVGGLEFDSLSDSFCAAEENYFADPHQDFMKKGGMKVHGEFLGRGAVLVMSLWDDHYARMLWLDSNYPTDVDPSTPGIARGPCPTSSGVPSEVESQYASATVIFSNIKTGPIGSTY